MKYIFKNKVQNQMSLRGVPLFSTLFVLGTLLLATVGCSQITRGPEIDLAMGFDSEEASLEERIGERLFREGRFSQFFSAQFSGDYNEVLSAGDPILEITQTTALPLVGPFAGQGISCVVCHRVDDSLEEESGGMRAYTDFARHSPVPLRGDGHLTTPRNSPPLVNATLPRATPMFLHYDGEFTNIRDLVKRTLTGRNHGWLPEETAQALRHVAKVIREDSAVDALAQEIAPYSYGQLFSGAEDLPEIWRLPKSDRLDLAQASDEVLLDTIAHFIGIYVESLIFVQDEDGFYTGSPYDQFLIQNELPRGPSEGESEEDYGRRLLQLLQSKEEWEFIEEGTHSSFQFHEQDFNFGESELAGLKIFLAEPTSLPLGAEQVSVGGIGNCLACHAPPNFTDFSFHNTGVAQDEYDKTHGNGEFQKLFIPDLALRNAQAALYLPPNGANPNGQGKYMAIPSFDSPGLTDLGLWNVLANPTLPQVQESLQSLLCAEIEQHFGASADCNEASLLTHSMARFKTSGLRDLGHSAPFMHNGEFEDLKAVLVHYQDFANLARSGQMRNAPQEFLGMALSEGDLGNLEAFLKSLNEDYE